MARKVKGSVQTFCGQMKKRSHQYMIRSMYDLLPGQSKSKKKRIKRPRRRMCGQNWVMV